MLFPASHAARTRACDPGSTPQTLLKQILNLQLLTQRAGYVSVRGWQLHPLPGGSSGWGPSIINIQHHQQRCQQAAWEGLSPGQPFSLEAFLHMIGGAASAFLALKAGSPALCKTPSYPVTFINCFSVQTSQSALCATENLTDGRCHSPS